MKKIFTFLALLIMNSYLFAQAPEGIIYQAEARDNAGNVIQNKMLDVKIQILEDNTSGTIVWEGLHNVTTNQFGMFVVVIGTGTNTYGDKFEEINWGDKLHFFNVQLKSNETTGWIDMGTAQFLSVPYALYAKTAGSVLPESGMELKSGKAGVPSQNWSLYGNLKTDEDKDKFGTTDAQDLVFVTDNIERLRITKTGKLITADGVGLELGGNLAVHGDSTYIDKDLYVGRNVFLNTDDRFSPLGETFNFGNFTVYGISTLNNSLFVKGPAVLENTLSTLGDVQFNSNLNVDGLTALNRTLYVEGATTLSNTIHVGGNAYFASELNVDGYFSVNNNMFTVDNSNGNTDIAGDLDVAGDGEFANLIVKGSGGKQGEHVALFENTDGGTADGIAIKINKPETTDENNFITFYRKDAVAGRIEGYHHNIGDTPAFVTDVVKPMLSSTGSFFKNTLGFTSPLSIDFGSLPTLSGGSWPSFSRGSLPSLSPWSSGSLPSLNFGSASFPTLHGGSIPSVTFNTGGDNLIQPWTWFSPDFESLKSVSDGNPMYLLFAEAYENDWKTLADMGITELFVKAAEMELEANIKSEGITYGSKGADYAEWLPRINEEDQLALGQVVGVFGGKISLNTENADQILVISSKPIVLGNMPEKDKEGMYEKVAFMGQVPTWVKGHVNTGDYIVASQKNDGAGIAVSPGKITAADIPNIVGKAWSESGNPVLSLINVAIGLNRNDIVKIVSTQQNQISNLESRLESIEERINTLTGSLSQGN